MESPRPAGPTPDALADAAQAADRQHLRTALAEAHRAIGLSDPNPRVGCVIVDATGREIARGHTQRAGEAHAEVMALRAARLAGHELRGATVYVTLEPCAHHGRTPPCCDALIAAGVGRVVHAIEDPNPLVAGQGLARLRAAGIVVSPGGLSDEARELNIGFFSRMQRGRPWVRLKVAASLDGRTALPDGRSQWITSAAARADGHAWRRRAGALLTGIGTVRDDDPRLDVRHVPTTVQPLRVVIDSRLEIDPQARILQPPGPVLIYTTRAADAARRAALAARDITVVDIDDASGKPGKTDLAAVLADLASRGVNELHVEAGHRLNGSLVQADLVDEYLVYLAPRLIGEGREMASFGPLPDLAAARDLRFTAIDRVGDDLRLLARPFGRWPRGVGPGVAPMDPAQG
jgi:diaminohydroxyphosphoribosylaminopyrimidine deaminase/5-amino-6-(5-phosphoribosylamino)uracil reductase